MCNDKRIHPGKKGKDYGDRGKVCMTLEHLGCTAMNGIFGARPILPYREEVELILLHRARSWRDEEHKFRGKACWEFYPVCPQPMLPVKIEWASSHGKIEKMPEPNSDEWKIRDHKMRGEQRKAICEAHNKKGKKNRHKVSVQEYDSEWWIQVKAERYKTLNEERQWWNKNMVLHCEKCDRKGTYGKFIAFCEENCTGKKGEQKSSKPVYTETKEEKVIRERQDDGGKEEDREQEQESLSLGGYLAIARAQLNKPGRGRPPNRTGKPSGPSLSLAFASRQSFYKTSRKRTRPPLPAPSILPDETQKKKTRKTLKQLICATSQSGRKRKLGQTKHKVTKRRRTALSCPSNAVSCVMRNGEVRPRLGPHP